MIRFSQLPEWNQVVTLVCIEIKAIARSEKIPKLLGKIKTSGYIPSEGRNIVNNSSNQISEFFNGESETDNSLWHYVQSLSPEAIGLLSKPGSAEVFQVIERNIGSILGSLPSEHFGVTISTSRENLGRLLASAMISGYFLRNAEQRMAFEKTLQTTDVYNSGQE